MPKKWMKVFVYIMLIALIGSSLLMIFEPFIR
ncbi:MULTISPECIES: stressosome-associated protein Prli42 [Paenibacillus]|nr:MULTISPECIES: stressosome-associated protein Prli42 [Paenibacillus]